MVVALDLRHFLLRAKVLKLYREALRAARMAPPHARAELASTIREEMECNRRLDDPQKIRFLLSEGKQRLKGLKEMLEMQGHA
ncbi:LYR family of Fe/S cluster biogenesis protein [Wolffia australiana]